MRINIEWRDIDENSLQPERLFGHTHGGEEFQALLMLFASSFSPTDRQIRCWSFSCHILIRLLSNILDYQTFWSDNYIKHCWANSLFITCLLFPWISSSQWTVLIFSAWNHLFLQGLLPALPGRWNVIKNIYFFLILTMNKWQKSRFPSSIPCLSNLVSVVNQRHAITEAITERRQ